jgi:hypothetical protein
MIKKPPHLAESVLPSRHSMEMTLEVCQIFDLHLRCLTLVRSLIARGVSGV